MNRRQFLQFTLVSSGLIFLRLKFPQLIKADDGSTPLPACLPFCLTSTSGAGVVTTLQPTKKMTRLGGYSRPTETGNGRIVSFGRRRFLTGILDE